MGKLKDTKSKTKSKYAYHKRFKTGRKYILFPKQPKHSSVSAMEVFKSKNLPTPLTLAPWTSITLTTNRRFMATNVEMLCVYSCLIVFDSRMFSRFGSRSIP